MPATQEENRAYNSPVSSTGYSFTFFFSLATSETSFFPLFFSDFYFFF